MSLSVKYRFSGQEVLSTHEEEQISWHADDGFDRQHFRLEPSDRATIWHRMGVVKMELKAFEDASNFFQKALEIREACFGPDDASTKKTSECLHQSQFAALQDPLEFSLLGQNVLAHLQVCPSSLTCVFHAAVRLPGNHQPQQRQIPYTHRTVTQRDAVLSSTSIVNTHGRARSIQDEIEDLHLTRSVEGTSSRTASLGSENSNALSVDEGGDEERMGQGGE